MTIVLLRSVQALLVGAVAVTTACSGNPRPASAPADARQRPIAQPMRPVSQADVHFMSGMIPHHAQAVKIARWAQTRGARSDLRVLAARIEVAQRDEIALMQTGCGTATSRSPTRVQRITEQCTSGMQHDMLMPGMLSEEEMAQLERARGAEFDRLFLTFMIRHHEGAMTMVETALCVVRCRAGRRRLPLRIRRLCRPDHGDPAHGQRCWPSSTASGR